MTEATSKPSSPGASSLAGPIALRTVNTVKTLAMDAVQAARSGHPGTPMGLAPLAYALWTHVMKYDSSAPGWPDRDRFVLSCGHASMLQYAMLHLTGYDLSLQAIRDFRQLGSPAAGHPERGVVPGVETTTGPLGQGIGNGVGLALAERMQAARYNADGCTLVDHRTWVIASDGDLMEGVASEAASLAGHLGLGRLCVFWDDNRITIDGTTAISFTEDVAARFASYGWHVLRVDVADGIDAYVAAADAARLESARPTLVCCRTHIGEGSPHKQDTSAAHGAPFGEEEVRLTKRALGWPEDAHFEVPDDVRAHMREAGRRGAATRAAWEQALEARRLAAPDLVAAFEAEGAGGLTHGWEHGLPSFESGASIATRKASGAVLAGIGPTLPQLVGGSADLAGSNNTTMPNAHEIARGDFSGRTIHFGVREHAMGAICNGLALHGGFRPYCGTFLVFSDYMRPSIRLAALMKLPIVYVFTHDSIGVGEDGPTHQPVEHVAALRSIPGLQVFRPADAAETVEAWRLALESAGPSALCLTRQGVPVLERGDEGDAAQTAQGAYVLHRGAAQPDVCLLATGSEVHLALDAARLLGEDGIAARVISMPCWERFEAQTAAAREAVFGDCALRIGIEAGCAQGWHRWVGPAGGLVTMSGFGASAPAPKLMEKFGFTAENVASVARRHLAMRAGANADGDPPA